MLKSEMVDILVTRLLETEEYDSRNIVSGLIGKEREISLALWDAGEKLRKDFDKVFVKTQQPYVYRLANRERRVKKVQSRTRAAGRIQSRQADEIHNLLQHTQEMSTEMAKTLLKLEERMMDLDIRTIIASRASKKKKPKGL